MKFTKKTLGNCKPFLSGLLLLSILSSSSSVSYGADPNDVFHLVRLPNKAENYNFFYLFRFPTEGIFLVALNDEKTPPAPLECELEYSAEGGEWSAPKRIGKSIDGGQPLYQVLSVQSSGRATITRGVSIEGSDILNEIPGKVSVDKGLRVIVSIYVYRLDSSSGEMTRLRIPSEIILLTGGRSNPHWHQADGAEPKTSGQDN